MDCPIKFKANEDLFTNSVFLKLTNPKLGEEDPSRTQIRRGGGWGVALTLDKSLSLYQLTAVSEFLSCYLSHKRLFLPFHSLTTRENEPNPDHYAVTREYSSRPPTANLQEVSLETLPLGPFWFSLPVLSVSCFRQLFSWKQPHEDYRVARDAFELLILCL